MTVNFDQLCFFICWYNDPSIIRLLGSLPKETHKIIVDGRFRGFNGNTPLSHPILRDTITSQYENITLLDAPDLTEVEKRNVYLQHAKDFRYGIWLDSDEYIKHVNWGRFFDAVTPLRTHIRHIFIQYPDSGNYQAHARIIIDPYTWRHHKIHFLFKNTQTGYICPTADLNVFLDDEIILINHDDSLRTPEYLNDSKAYQAELFTHEAQLIKQFIN